MIGSTQFQVLNGHHRQSTGVALVFLADVVGWCAYCCALGCRPWCTNLRLRGDYLAIVTLGFGEIVPIIFLELDKYTNGTNGHCWRLFTEVSGCLQLE